MLFGGFWGTKNLPKSIPLWVLVDAEPLDEFLSSQILYPIVRCPQRSEYGTWHIVLSRSCFSLVVLSLVWLVCLFGWLFVQSCQIYTLLTHTSSMNFMLWLKATQEKRLLLLRVNFRVELGESTTSVVTCLVRI